MRRISERTENETKLFFQSRKFGPGVSLNLVSLYLRLLSATLSPLAHTSQTQINRQGQTQTRKESPETL